MATAKFLLEHFYYGKLVHHGKPAGDNRLLGSSAGVDSELAALAVERLSLPPLVGSDKGTWAIVRGKDKQLPFMLVQTQQGKAGEITSHYIIATPEVLRAVSGNMSTISALIEDNLPVYETLGDTLKPLEIDQPDVLAVDLQVDEILELMMITKNRIPAIEALLSAIVQGVQIIVKHAPPKMATRLDLIAGLLALLPRSVRFGVTFATHATVNTDINAQILFFGDDPPHDGTLVFDWRSGEVSGKTVEDEYSRYVISQLRLDTELAIERTNSMTHIAAWRLNNGDKLADALAYAGKRLRLDESLRTNQPVNAEDVAEILSTDTTLDKDLRGRYGEHLMRLSLAMRDMSRADPVATILREDSQLEASALKQMQEAEAQGEHELVYETLVRWLANPMGPQSRAWTSLLGSSGLSVLKEIVEDDDAEDALDFLQEMQNVGATMPLGEMIPEVVRIIAPLSEKDTAISQNLFLLAVRFLDDAQLSRLMSTPSFMSRQPKLVRDLWAKIQQESDDTNSAPEMVKIGGEISSAVMLRFAELAAANNKPYLISTQAWILLRDFAFSDEGKGFSERLLRLVNRIEAQAGAVKSLETPATNALLQIHLALGDYRQLGTQLLQQSVELYPGDLQVEYLKAVEKVFIETPFPAENVGAILDALSAANIKSAPYVTAAICALNQKDKSADLDAIAADCEDMLNANHAWLEVIPPTTVLCLLTYHARNKDLENTIRASSIVPLSAAYHEQGDVKIMSAMYKRMKWSPQTETAALQMLRTFVREAQDEEARRAVGFFGRELGKAVRQSLESTYILRRFMNETDLVTYAHDINAITAFLTASAGAFANSRTIPSPGDIIGVIDGLSGSLIRDEYAMLSHEVLNLGRTIAYLGETYQEKRGRNESKHINSLLTGEINPKSAVDVLWVMGGYFSRGKHFEYIVAETSNPLGLQIQTMHDLRDAISRGERLLHSSLRTLPPTKSIKLTSDDIRREVESMWSMVTEEQQRKLVRGFAENLQRIPVLIAYIVENGDTKAVEPDSNSGKKIDSGRQKPKNTLELYRYLHSYFKGRS
ncbi:MAG: hypothetical protein RLP44_05175 [Aggregatilineales bacterium]